MEKLKQFLSWKYMLPVGLALLWIANFKSAIGLIGLVIAALGLFDLFKMMMEKNKISRKTKNNIKKNS